ncbi:MAG: DUF1540 domain-containing protein [Anaeroplasma sp.]
MTKVSCNAKTCGYNSCEFCTKKNIDIEGLFAKSKIGTFCQSFKNPHGNNDLKMEMASEMTTDTKVSVACSANYCRFNQDDYCHKDDILIGNEKAQYRSETQCDSFRLKLDKE